jgi:hypothetical protein
VHKKVLGVNFQEHSVTPFQGKNMNEISKSLMGPLKRTFLTNKLPSIRHLKPNKNGAPSSADSFSIPVAKNAVNQSPKLESTSHLNINNVKPSLIQPPLQKKYREIIEKAPNLNKKQI